MKLKVNLKLLKKLDIIPKIPIPRLSKKAGLPPGTYMHIGEKKTEKVSIDKIEYKGKYFSRINDIATSELSGVVSSNNINWVNCYGLHDTDIIVETGKLFDLHPLMIEDILNTGQRAKAEEFGESFMIACKMLSLGDGKIQSEHISIVLNNNSILSFQEMSGDIFDGLRKRLEDSSLRIRNMGADYLFYRLVDTIVDYYFLIIEFLADEINELEEELLLNIKEESIIKIQATKKKLLVFEKAVVPLKDAFSSIKYSTPSTFKEETIPFLNDVYDHLVQLSDSIESQKEMIITLTELFHSGMSTKMNQVMQVLTIIATIFIPLTFIAGIYGMNFEYMPELHYKYSYFIVWGIMLTLIAIMLYYFRRKRWL